MIIDRVQISDKFMLYEWSISVGCHLGVSSCVNIHTKKHQDVDAVHTISPIMVLLVYIIDRIYNQIK